MDTLHRFTFFSGHDRHQLSGRLFHILIEENVIILMRLCIFPPRTLEPLGHRLRRDITPVDEPLPEKPVTMAIQEVARGELTATLKEKYLK